MKIISTIVIAISFAFASQSALFAFQTAEQADQKSDPVEFKDAFAQLSSAAEKLLEKQISPPSRQQMYLSACRGMYTAAQKIPPTDLTQTFSGAVASEEFRDLLSQTWNELNKENTSTASLYSNAMETMLADVQIGCEFISANQSRINRQLSENQYVGIGIKVARKDGLPMIAHAYYGGPAQKAGARDGDLILSVDGKALKGMAFGDTIGLLRGPKGSKLTVELLNINDSVERTYEMTRDVVPIDSVTGSKRNEQGEWQLTANGVPSEFAYLKLTGIVGSTSAELLSISQRLESNPPKGLIVDCSELGGFGATDLHHLNMVLDVFIGEAAIAEVVTRERKHKMKTQSEHGFKNIPIALITNQKPTGLQGPEFLFFDAMKRHRSAKIVGRPLVSHGLCSKSIELDNDMGALSNVYYAALLPTTKETRIKGPQPSTHDLTKQTLFMKFGDAIMRTKGPFNLVPDAPVDMEGDFIGAAVRILQTDLLSRN